MADFISEVSKLDSLVQYSNAKYGGMQYVLTRQRVGEDIAFQAAKCADLLSEVEEDELREHYVRYLDHLVSEKFKDHKFRFQVKGDEESIQHNLPVREVSDKQAEEVAAWCEENLKGGYELSRGVRALTVLTNTTSDYILTKIRWS